MTWQDILTAPRDGTAFLGFIPERGGYVACQTMQVMAWSEWGGGIWETTGGGGKYSNRQVTHWQPLPEPPDDL